MLDIEYWEIIFLSFFSLRACQPYHVEIDRRMGDEGLFFEAK
jgi:hypothetical protein